MILMLINFAYHDIKTRSSRVRCKSMLLLVPLNVGTILGKYAGRAPQSMQRKLRPKDLLRLLCATLVHKKGPFHGYRSQNPNDIHKIVRFYGWEMKSTGIYVEPSCPCWAYPEI